MSVDPCRFASVGRNVSIHESVVVFGAEHMHIGNDVRIDAFTVLSAGPDGCHIGDHVHIAAYVFISGSGGRVTIGDFAGISTRCTLYTSNDDYSGAALTGPTVPTRFTNVTRAPLVVGRHVVVGAGSIVLPGVTFGEGSAAGALSLVREDVPAWTIVGGVPARHLMTRSRALLEQEAALGAEERRGGPHGARGADHPGDAPSAPSA